MLETQREKMSIICISFLCFVIICIFNFLFCIVFPTFIKVSVSSICLNNIWEVTRIISIILVMILKTSLVAQISVCLHCRRPGFNPWVRKISWRRKWQPTPVSLPGKSHGRRSLVGYKSKGSQRVGHD